MLQKRGIAQPFSVYRNSLNEVTRLSKPNNYKNVFEDNKNKLNKVWKGIEEIFNVNKKSPNKLGTRTTMES